MKENPRPIYDQKHSFLETLEIWREEILENEGLLNEQEKELLNKINNMIKKEKGGDLIDE